LDKPSGAAFSNRSASELARDSENTSLTRCAGDPASATSGHSVILKNVGVNSDGAAGAKALDSSGSAQALDSRRTTLVSAPKAQAPSDWVYALKDVSFEVRRGWGWVAGFGCFVNSSYLIGSGFHSVILKNVGMANQGIILQDNGL